MERYFCAPCTYDLCKDCALKPEDDLDDDFSDDDHEESLRGEVHEGLHEGIDQLKVLQHPLSPYLNHIPPPLP